KGEGIWLYTADGDQYLDFYNNVASLGHCHPQVVEAMTKQAHTLSTNTRYLHDTIIEYSERLTDLFPDPLSQAIYTCTGSEANDLACRIAKYHTGGEGYIVSEYAYHGTSHLISSLSPNLGPTVSLHPNLRTVPAPHSFDPSVDVGEQFTAHVQAAIDDLQRRGIKPAALLVDSIFSSDGVYTEPKGFLKGAVKAIHKAGGLFIADEVQPGFARTGDHMWGFQRHGVTPDLVTLGKPMGNGYPMSGVIARPEVSREFGASARYFNTFAGNTVAAANGLAVLNVIRDQNLLENSYKMGAYLKEALESIASSKIAEVRGSGLFYGVEIVQAKDNYTPDEKTAKAIVNALRKRKTLISTTGKNDNILKVRPPLIVTKENIDQFINTLQDVMSELGVLSH
ncbi:MAG: aspartate aminotransferase family protein, partial [Pseudomonadota bacterium]